MIGAAAVLLVVGVAANIALRVVAPLVLVLVIGTILRHHLLRWRTLLGAVVLCILLVPMRRYSIAANLPIQLELYRLIVALVACVWISSLLIDRRIRILRTGLEKPLAAIVLAYIASDVVNARSINAQGLDSYVVKGFTFLASFVAVMYIVVSVIRSARDLDWLIRLLVGAGAFVGLSSVVEDRTRFNVFNHLHAVLPMLRFAGLSWNDLHDTRVRAMGSAEHPIALGVGLAMLLPLSLYLIRRTGQARWTIAAALLMLGTLSSRSRTPMLMLVAMLLVFLWLRPSQVRRYWPALVPIALAAQLAMPGLTSTLVHSFFPKGGLVAQQAQGAGTYGSGRVADLGPGLAEWAQHPFVGQGFQSRITDRVDPHWNAPILDDQWLGTLLETGLVGVLAWAWMFARIVRRFGKAAKREPGPRGLLFVALAASTAAYAVSMATYDAFAFTQEIFILFLLVAIGCVALRFGEHFAPVGVLRPAHAASTSPR